MTSNRRSHAPDALILVVLYTGACGGTTPTGTDGGDSPDMTTLPGAQCPRAGRPAPASGTCTVTAGGAGWLLTGNVLLPGMVLHGGQVAVDAQGTITCVDCDCTAAAAGAAQIDCPVGVISPGLINTHDQISYTQDSPAADTGERYEQRNDWRRGLRGHTAIVSKGGASTDQIRWGELRFVLGGATSTVGSGNAPGLLRNLDAAALEEGLGHAAVVFDTFPLGDVNGTQLASGCQYAFKDTSASIASLKSFEPHIAEGIDAVAHNEFVCTSSGANGGQDLTQPQSAFIHSIGLGAADYSLMAREHVSVIWSPRSNLRLYGNTASVTVAARLGVRIALGTDWMPTGSMNLLRELACADSLNTAYFDHAFTDEDLWKMVTLSAAQVTATDDAIGLLATGKIADIAIFDGSKNTDYRAVIAAQPADVILVMRAGKLLYGDASVVTALPGGAACEAQDVCGVAKSVCLKGDTGETFAALAKAAASAYPLFFCGVPKNEPTCVPQRPMAVDGSTIYTGQSSATDGDGDGIADAMDDCPRVFNPIRPLDSGKQPDADGDGVGDACDGDPLTK